MSRWRNCPSRRIVGAPLTDSQKWLVLTTALLALALLYALAPVLTPFLLSALLAYLGDPVVDWLQRLGLGRSGSVVLVFVLMLMGAVIALFVLLPLLQRQLISLISGLPQLLEWLQLRLAPQFESAFGLEVMTFDIEAVRRALAEHWRSVGSFAGNFVAHLGRSGQVVLGWISYLVLLPVVTFYLLRDWDRMVAAIDGLIPKYLQPTVAKLAREIDAVLAEFLRGQLSVMFVLGLLYAAGLWLVGLELAIVIGLLAGVVSFVPYLGVIVGIAVAGFAAFVQFGDVGHLLGVLAVFGFGQLLEAMVLSPLLVGDRIGLHPVAVLFAIMAGGQLFGFFGILVALPVAAAIVVVLRHVRDEYLDSNLYA